MAIKIRQDAQEALRLDANETLTLEQQLENMETTLYRERFPENTYAQAMPVTTSGEFSKSESFRFIKEFGRAAWASDTTTEPPLVNLAQEKEEIPTRKLHAAYSIDYDELQFSSRQNIAIDLESARVARRVIDTSIDEGLYWGNADVNLPGLLSDLGDLTQYTVPNGAGGNPQFETKTGLEILTDINAALRLVISATGEVFKADTLLMPEDLVEILKDRYVGDNLKTVFEHLTIIRPDVRIIGVPRLASGAAGNPFSENFMVAFPRTKEVLNAKVPIPFRQKPIAYTKSYDIYRECFARVAGVERKHPKAIVYARNV